MRALRPPDLSTALSALVPALSIYPLFFFDQVRGVICLNDPAKQLLQDLLSSQDQFRMNRLTGSLLEAYEEGRVIRQEGWPNSEYTLVAVPIASPEGDVKGVLALMTTERQPPPLAQFAEPDVITEQRDWLTIGSALRVHALRPLVHVRRNGADSAEGEVLSWQEYQLSYLEETLLRHLLKHPAEVQTAETLFRVVWPDDDVYTYGLRPEQQDRLRRLIYQVRQHTEPDPRNPRFVVTAHGVGYVLYPEYVVAVH
jgi:hypothetical protein